MYFGSAWPCEYDTDLICGEHVLHSLGDVTHNDHNAGDGRTRMDDLCKLVGGQGSLQSESESTYSGIQEVCSKNTKNIQHQDCIGWTLHWKWHYNGWDITSISHMFLRHCDITFIKLRHWKWHYIGCDITFIGHSLSMRLTKVLTSMRVIPFWWMANSRLLGRDDV